MLVSAFWHGIHPGYYLSFLTIPPTLTAEKVMDSAFREGANGSIQVAYDWMIWFFKMRAFEYMCMGFLLLRFDHTVAYWASIYFAHHIVIIVFIVVGNVFKKGRAIKTEKPDKNTKETQ